MITEDQREIKNLRKYLRELIKVSRAAITALDDEMKKSFSNERGEQIAKICNFLEINTDIAARYGLAEKFKGEK